MTEIFKDEELGKYFWRASPKAGNFWAIGGTEAEEPFISFNMHPEDAKAIVDEHNRVVSLMVGQVKELELVGTVLVSSLRVLALGAGKDTEAVDGVVENLGELAERIRKFTED